MSGVKSISGQSLVGVGRRVETPFQLELDAASISPNYVGSDVPRLTITEILRIVPGVRLVGLAIWQGKQIVVKMFYQPVHFNRHFRRENEGLDALKELDVATASKCFTAQLKDASALLIATDYLRDAKSLSLEMLETTDSLSSVQLVCRVISCIAQGHRRGVWQADIHPDNFLIRDSEVFQIDAAEIQRERDSQDSGLSLEKSLSNLALFLAQFPVFQDEHIEEYLRHYTIERDQGQQLENPEAMLSRVTQARIKRLTKYEKKLLRATSEHECRRTPSMFLLYDRSMESAEFERFVADPDSFIPAKGRIKNGNSSTVVKITLDGRAFILKRYNILGVVHRIRRLFTRSRAINSWIYASTLLMLGVSTGRPYAALERRIFGTLPSTSYFLSEFVEGDHVLHTVAEFQDVNQGLQPANGTLHEIMGAFETLFSIFRRYRISHGDFKASNFIYTNARLFVLDLDSMRRHHNDAGFERKHAKDLRRFIKNWQGSPLAKDLEERLLLKERES